MEENDRWKPNEKLLQVMLSMGIDRNAAEEALFCTGNDSVELAVAYLYSKPSNDTFPSDTDTNEQATRVSNESPEEDPQGSIRRSGEAPEGGDVDDSCDTFRDFIPTNGYKMAFVVNTSLKMGVGKLAAQVAHACLGLYREMSENDLMLVQLEQWNFFGEKKVVLKGTDHNQLEELYNTAKESNISCYLVHDAGRTQIPANSVTVLSIFGLESDVNKISGTLNLL